jgi:hypothetical protein
MQAGVKPMSEDKMTQLGQVLTGDTKETLAELERLFIKAGLDPREDETAAQMIYELKALIATQRSQAFREGETAFARKVLAVAGGLHKIKGFTQAKRLQLLTDKCMEIIPPSGLLVDEAEGNHE